MANTVIQLKYSAIPGNIPSNLANGEIAINSADGHLYYKNTTGHVVTVVATGDLSAFSTIDANGSILTALSNSSVLTINPGDNIAITSDIINDIITISANLAPAFVVANAAFAAANNVAPQVTPAFNTANAAYTVANAAFDKANTAKSNSFTTISVPGQSNITSSVEDTLTFSGSDNINISTNASSKTVTFAVTPGSYNGDYGFIYEPAIFTHDYGSL